ncbi:MAG TPA: N-acetylmuramoyl-L-alanine amidase [Luteolibacter sp.]|nr:N-acetylmuramoyl-L-alanine amidase [Luteolibacter sp.]
MNHILRLFVFCAACVMGSSAWAANFRTVVIDAGHGGHDNGGQWGKVYEKHLALDTAVRLENRLKQMGYKTVMTRRSDYFVSLPRRVAIGNSHKNAIFVSIHYNYTWKQHVTGLETFYHCREGQQLAHFVQRSLVRHTRTVDRNAKFARYYVIRNSAHPAILVEGGFVSNEEERERMKSGDYRESIARAVAEGIHRYRRGF